MLPNSLAQVPHFFPSHLSQNKLHYLFGVHIGGFSNPSAQSEQFSDFPLHPLHYLSQIVS